MNMKEFCRKFAVTKDVIKAFLHAGLLKGFEDDLERDCLCCFAVQRLETCLCLHALGFDIQTIKAYCSLAESEDDTRVLRKEMLQERRDQHLKNAHRIKKTLDCLDAVLQKLKSVTGGGT